MMEFTSYNNRLRVLSIFKQIEKAIEQLQEWNNSVKSVDDYYLSPEGMQKLAANCMLIEAIGEGIHQINRITGGNLLSERSEIPWEDVIGIRNHIAHGYFDIDAEIVLSVIKNDLLPLLEAIRYFINELSTQ
ncbi:MAG: DUF86 domain-containing protein [Bacteroidaceae bacterium]|nr:DUF86 domain-containing protein [Bacteroidaceae bacterium]